MVRNILGGGERDRRRLKKLLTSGRGVIALERAYLLSSDDRRNVARAEHLRNVLRELKQQHDYLPPPRIIVRVDRYRQARHYVTEQLQDWAPGPESAESSHQPVSAFISVIGRHQLTAQMLAQHIAERGQPDHVVVVGRTDLAEAFCDDYSTQRAAAGLLAASIQGPNDMAVRMLEFQSTKASLPDVVRVDDVPGLDELVRLQDEHRRTSVVITTVLDEQGLASLEDAALKLDGGSIRIFVLNESTSGLSEFPMLGTLHTFGLSLGGRRIERTPDPEELFTRDPLVGVPPDVWLRSARLASDAYGISYGPNSWVDDDPEARESNMRALRHVLWYLTSNGFEWVASRDVGIRADPVPPDLLDSFVEKEHENWVQFKRHHRWVGTKAETTDKKARENHLLFPWKDLPEDRRKTARTNTLGSVELVLQVLAVQGIHPVRIAPRRYVRSGEVRLVRTVGDAGESWTTETGQEMQAKPGDHVLSDGTREWTIGPEELAKTYRPVSADIWARTGEVTAQLAYPGETVESREGPQTAEAGQWRVTDDAGNSWLVPADKFEANYRPKPAAQ
ncbi:hypothetical protein FOJ82_13490 [Tessaracoccus rhinocerotis]|uniref:Ryanodine receptor Ryr domain-containing protein n=1 Tax=Tessaracoccus rhinocerotis TaxID=1689449 RepID=A0A553JWN1_9ACTN|nr:hypothetical protein FOJ82_13490 [Tessaracoccus rhinocerotis]